MSELGRLFGDKPAPLHCPGCGHQLQVPAKFAFDGGNAECSNCGAQITIQGCLDDPEVRKAEEALKSLLEDLRKPRRLNIRFDVK